AKPEPAIAALWALTAPRTRPSAGSATRRHPCDCRRLSIECPDPTPCSLLRRNRKVSVHIEDHRVDPRTGIDRGVTDCERQIAHECNFGLAAEEEVPIRFGRRRKRKG